jgi:DNA-binding response OmpR family regulator
MPMILLVGEDEILQKTRAAVLHTTGAETVTSTPVSAMAVLSSRACDLLVLCHSLPELVAAGLIAAFRSRWPVTPILRMASLRAWEVLSDDDKVEAVASADPDRLVKRSSELLGVSITRRPTRLSTIGTVRGRSNKMVVAPTSGY